MADRLGDGWRDSRQLHISAAYEFNEAKPPPVHDGSEVPSSTRSAPPAGEPTPKVTTMFSLFRRKARKSAYTWKPALDLTDPRIAAVLLAFGRA